MSGVTARPIEGRVVALEREIRELREDIRVLRKTLNERVDSAFQATAQWERARARLTEMERRYNGRWEGFNNILSSFSARLDKLERRGGTT